MVIESHLIKRRHLLLIPSVSVMSSGAGRNHAIVPPLATFEHCVLCMCVRVRSYRHVGYSCLSQNGFSCGLSLRRCCPPILHSLFRVPSIERFVRAKESETTLGLFQKERCRITTLTPTIAVSTWPRATTRGHLFCDYSVVTSRRRCKLALPRHNRTRTRTTQR
jgi:hypothetical protein